VRKCAGKLSKSEKMGAKFVRTTWHFDHLEVSWKKTSTKTFYPMYCRCTRIKIFRYLVTGCHEKLSSSYRIVPNAHQRANVCARRKSIKPCNFQKCFWAFSLCRQMAPLQSIKFQIADFPIFWARIIVIFWTTYIARETVLSVLHCLKRGIAFVLFLLLFFL